MGEKDQGPKKEGRSTLEASLIGLFVLVTAHTAAAVLDMRGWPMWTSIAAAVLVFPILPVGWHVWAERRRRQKKDPPKAKTTGKERFILRVLAVAVLVVVALGFTVGKRAISAVKNHSGWMIPDPPPQEACAEVAKTFYKRLEELADDDDDWALRSQQGLVHYQCIAGDWSSGERECISDSIDDEVTFTGLWAQDFLKSCELHKRGRDFEPDEAPDCARLAKRAAEIAPRVATDGPKGATPADRSDELRAQVQRVCTDSKWNKRLRTCLDIVWRYSATPACDARGEALRSLKDVLVLPEKPAKTEPAKTEPAKTEPAKTEPAKTEPAKTEPAKTEPAKTEPAKTEPAKTEPAKTEPAPEKPATTEPAPEKPAPEKP